MHLLTLVTMFTAIAASNSSAPYLMVLGVAQDAGHPQAGCTQAHCTKAFEKPSKAHHVASLGLVDPASGSYWILDATPDLPLQLHRLEQRPDTHPQTLGGIFITHAHIGHYTGLMHLGREVMGSQQIPVYTMPRMQEFLTNNGPWSQLIALGNIQLVDCQSPVQLTDTLAVEAIVVPHRDEFSETVGFRIKGPSLTALYLPDIDKWERWDQALEDVLDTVDVAYIDGTFFDEGELPGRDMSTIPHPFIAETMKRLESAPVTTSQKDSVHSPQPHKSGARPQESRR